MVEATMGVVNVLIVVVIAAIIANEAWWRVGRIAWRRMRRGA